MESKQFESGVWKTLENLAQDTAAKSYAQLTEQRTQMYKLDAQGIGLDFTYSAVNDDILSSLFELAEQQQLADWIAKMFAGEKINSTEQRAVLHTLLRQPESAAVPDALNANLTAVHAALAHMQTVVERIYQGNNFGCEAVKDVVHIGVGGSSLGPEFCTSALQEYWQENSASVNVHYISGMDGWALHRLLPCLDANSTVFILASKTFTTEDTFLNAAAAKSWLENNLPDANAEQISSHFIACTASEQKAVDWGVAQENIVPFWQWVGGRYSIWSSIALPLVIKIGMQNFQQFLHGANALDEHFKTAPLAENLPVMFGLLNVWHHTFLQYPARAILPYDERLKLLPNYLQQLIMESNGKNLNRDNQLINYATSPIVFGGVGAQSQHSFYQLLHQGTQKVFAQFLVVDQVSSSDLELADTLKKQIAAAQRHQRSNAEILMCGGASLDEATLEGFPEEQVYVGGKASTTLTLESLTPKSLGELIAIYEHATFVESILLDINAFDQYGVELGKRLSKLS